MFFRNLFFLFLFTLYFLWFPSMPFLYAWFLCVLGFEDVNIPTCRVAIQNLPKWLIQDLLVTIYFTYHFVATPIFVFALMGVVFWLNVGPLFLFLPFHFQMGVFSFIMFDKFSIFSCTKFIKWKRYLDCNCTIFDISTFTMWCMYFIKKHCANNV